MTAAYEASSPITRRRVSLIGWTDERTELMKKLWAHGASASQISDQLGGTTRNAVVGKVHRMGLHRGEASTMQTRVARVKKRNRHRLAFGKPSSGVQLKPAAIPVPHAPSLEFKVGFFDLTAKRCHFPLWGDDDPPLHEKFYCGATGADIDAGIPYCPFHERHTHSGFPHR